MASVRPVQRTDLPAIAALVAAELPGWRRDAATLERALLGHPWTGEPPVSLVAVDGDRIIGSIGAQRRRLIFDGLEREGVAVSHLAVASDARGGAAGALLVRALLAGAQDLTFTDDSTRQVERVWRLFGAAVDQARVAEWLIVLRPGPWAAQVAASVVRPARRRRGALPIDSVPLAGIGLRPRGRPEPVLDPEVTGQDAGPEELAAWRPAGRRGARLWVDFDAASLRFTFDHLTALGAPVRARLVRRAGRPIGWYAVIVRPVADRVIHVVAEPDDVDALLGEMVAAARARGVRALTGRVEPHLTGALRSWAAGIGLAHRPLLHARDPELRAACASGAALLSEMSLVDAPRW